ncbi:MAG TPA: RNA-binding protein [Gammaproteobacteria bacterium]|nr:RNA-binding protein [Gammaproteobacteria bacterium]
MESIFIGNLAFRASNNAVRELFEQYGEVHAVRLMTDRVSRKPRGFGFVEMNHRDAMKAIKALQGKEFQGRELKVNIANERKPREEVSTANG